MARPSRTKTALITWLPFAVGITLIAGAAYFFAPHYAGATSSGPLSRLAVRVASELDGGKQVVDVLSSTVPQDITSATDPYVVVLDQKGNVIASSAKFQGKPLVIPPGMFTFVSDQGWDGAEWQPAPGVRQDLSIRKYQSGYVVVGRKAASANDSDPGVRRLVVALWGAGLVAAFGLALLRPVKLRMA